MDSSLWTRLEAIRAKLQTNADKPDAFAFVPEAVDYTESMLEVLRVGPSHPRHGRVEREKLVGALGRIVLEDLAFAESAIGSELLEVAEDFLVCEDSPRDLADGFTLDAGIET